MRAPSEWPQDVFRVLKDKGIATVATIPDAGLTELLKLCAGDETVRLVTLSTEEEGIGLGLGVWLGGGRALVCMQSSGAGNCINALALPAATATPCLMLVTMRGQQGEGNPWQVPMGRGVRPAFEAMGVSCLEAQSADQVAPLFERAADLAFGEGRAVALLIAQSVLGIKRFGG